MYEEQRFTLNDIQLHVTFAGAQVGKPLLLLHGFPDDWGCWRLQVDALVAHGYRVIIPDQRGYNRSSKPQAVRDYDIQHLVEDMIGLIDALGYSQVDLAGHDWGGVVAFQVAALHPQRIRKLMILNAPHLSILYRTLMRDVSQFLRSWYIGLFQIPWLPERLMLNGILAPYFLDGDGLEPSVAGKIHRQKQQAWRQPDAMRCMMNWYRAAARSWIRQIITAAIQGKNLYKLFPPPKITVPTLILWGKYDKFLGTSLADQSRALCQQATLHFLDGGHWIQIEQPAEVSQMMLDFLG